MNYPKEVKRILEDHSTLCTTGHLNTALEELNDLITKAKVEELKNCCEECGFWHSTPGIHGIAQTFSERIKELEQK